MGGLHHLADLLHMGGWLLQCACLRAAERGLHHGIRVTGVGILGDSRSMVGRAGGSIFPSIFQLQFEQPYGVTRPPTMFTIPVLRRPFALYHGNVGKLLLTE